MRSLAAIVACWLVVTPAAGETRSTSTEADAERPPSATSLEPAPVEGSLFAAGVAVVPGVLLHGAGHFALGERRSAYRLLAMEGIGLAGMVGGLGMLIAVGGSEKIAALYVPVLVGGVGLFSISFLADLAGSLHGSGPWPLPIDLPGFRLRIGYAGLFGSEHDFRHLGLLGVEWQGERLWLEGQATLHPEGAYSAYRGLLGWTLWRRPHEPVTRLRLVGEFVRQGFHSERMSLTTGRVFGELRWNLGGWVPTMQNAWLLGRLGAGLDVFGYADAPASDEGLPFLVADIGMGLMVGRRVEVELAYRHRKGELPGGLALSDGLTGFAGMLELRGRVRVTEWWTIVPEVKLGTGVMTCLWIESRLF